MKIIYMIFLQFVVVSMVSSCDAMTPQENFKDTMQFNVGKELGDPTSYLTRYSEGIVGNHVLPNGNTEIEWNQNPFCHVFFEIDVKTNTIINWRSEAEGSEQHCSITP